MVQAPGSAFVLLYSEHRPTEEAGFLQGFSEPTKQFN